MQNFENPVRLNSEKLRKNSILPHLLLLWVAQPNLSYETIIRLTLFLDAGKDRTDYRGRIALIEGLPEELFLHMRITSPKAAHFYYTILQFLTDNGTKEEQIVLLNLLRKKELL